MRGRRDTRERSGGPVPDGPGAIQARIIDVDEGLRLISGIRAVRLHSRGGRLLILEDHAPLLGKVEGSVTLLTDGGEAVFSGIRGFYKHQHNEFTLLIEERDAAGDGTEAAT